MENSRREFIRKMGMSSAVMAINPLLWDQKEQNILTRKIQLKESGKNYHANDNIQIALIGAGGMGNADLETALTVPGVKLVAACDLYDGRLKILKDKYGKEIFTTKNYAEILDRKDIDAVIIATPDHWHKKISVDALTAGKAVYCEKPMVHSIDEGAEVIAAQKKSGKIFQVGSQGISSLGNEKAKELLESGIIGDINYVEGFWARRDPIGAWQYPIPDDANETVVDWNKYIEPCHNKRTYDPLRFFRWRNYRDYGTGMCGDLFVHLFTSLHFITGSFGPEKIYASGGLRYWKDQREVPDVLLGTFDYPESRQHKAFNLSLRCNFVDGTSGTTYLRIVGSEGSMDVKWEEVIVYKNNAAMVDQFAKNKMSDDKLVHDRKKMLPPDKLVYKAEEGWMGAHYDHFFNFFNAIRNKKDVVEDALFGFRAATPALLCNNSYFENKIVYWDPEQLKFKKG